MKNIEKKEVLFVTSYPPRECGLATYSQDLIHAIKNKFGNTFSVTVCALEETNSLRKYPDEVRYRLQTTDFNQYVAKAEEINNNPAIAAVMVQHEFGLFGGKHGENLLYFLYTLTKPILVTFHTVLPDPDEKRREIVKGIAAAADGIVVMTQHAAGILRGEYEIPTDKITVIPHGTHLFECIDRNRLKEKLGLNGRKVLSTFGLLSSGKNIETALDALPAIIRRFPDTLYLVIGKTHPAVVKQEGEKYRASLEQKVAELGVSDHVRFINRYLSREELLQYLSASDIYLFTSKDPNQAVSGTFAYALSCSCPVIATPIPHAKEMLSGNEGIIADFGNSVEFAEAAIKILGDEELRKSMSRNALHRIRPTIWENSALAHMQLIRKITKHNLYLNYSLPGISLEHVRRMTTHAGMIQFSDISSPDLSSGYTLDDNARALIAALDHYKLTGDDADIRLIDIYLNFIKFSQQANGKFLNYVDEQGLHLEKNKYENLEDANGRAIWATGYLLSYHALLHPYFAKRALSVMQKALPEMKNLESPRAIAFAVKGLYFCNTYKQEEEVTDLIKHLADKLVSMYHKVFDAEWKWFENYLTYANSVLPEALLYAYLLTGNELYKTIARNSFDFLLSNIFTKESIKVISNKGWKEKNKPHHGFGEQPIDVTYTILALDVFYKVFGKEEYRQKMETAFSWFLGNNHLNQVIYNPVSGGCYDGLEEHHVNLNQGAESSVCYLIARLVMDNYEWSNEEIHEMEESKPVFEPLFKNPGYPILLRKAG